MECRLDVMTERVTSAFRVLMVHDRPLVVDVSAYTPPLDGWFEPEHPFPVLRQTSWQQQFWRLAAEPNLRDVTIDQCGRIWVDRGHTMVEEHWWGPPPTAEELSDFAIDLVAAGGRHIDSASPVVDVVLTELGGLRVHAVLPPISAGGAVISLRRPVLQPTGLAALGADCVPAALTDWLREQFLARNNLLICGASGSGKTTLLAALLAELPETERIIAIEDIPELNVPRGNYVQLCARQANSEGAGSVSTSALLVEALRMRPDRIVLGELRGAEFADLLTALNTGHNGGATSCHASSLETVPARLEALGALAGLGREAVAQQVIGAIHYVIQLERVEGVRRVAAVGRFRMLDERLSIERLAIAGAR